MRHDCEQHGCFEKKYRCQLGKLDHLFPGNNGLTDIDGFCYIDGRFLFIEWKTGKRAPMGKQREALWALSQFATVILAWGDAITMEPEAFWIIKGGKEEIITDGAARKFHETLSAWGLP